MKIKIDELTLIKVSLFVLIALFFGLGYFVGYNGGIIFTEHPKGDGEHFYSEVQGDSDVNDNFFDRRNITYHSTVDCPEIKTFLEVDVYEYEDSTGISTTSYSFCPNCMDEQLIEQCKRNIDQH